MGAGVCRPLPRPLHKNFRLRRDGPPFYATGPSEGGAITLRRMQPRGRSTRSCRVVEWRRKLASEPTVSNEPANAKANDA